MAVYLEPRIFVSFLLIFVCTTSVSCECQGCEDYYGICRRDGDVWVDDKTWKYSCQNLKLVFTGCITSKRGDNQLISPNTNLTINNFWFSCSQSEAKLKYEQEPSCTVNDTTHLHVDDTFREGVFQKICKLAGVWVGGCYYKDETDREHLLAVGESTYVGLVGHNCKEISSNPGRIRYWTSLKPNVTIATPADRGVNNNLPENVTNLLTKEPIPWSLFNAQYFIKNNDEYNEKIRYLA